MRHPLNNIILSLCLLLLCACGAKEEGASSDNEDTAQDAAVNTQSVLDAAELDPIQEQRTGLVFAEAEKTLNTVESILKSGATPALLAARGLLQSQLEEGNAAFDSLTEAVQLHASAEMYALRAFVLWRNGHTRGAFRDAEYALYKSKKLPIALMSMGLVRLSQSQEANDDETNENAPNENTLDEACTLLQEACAGGQCFGLEEAKKQGMCLK